jgi:hypothetical protein
MVLRFFCKECGILLAVDSHGQIKNQAFEIDRTGTRPYMKIDASTLTNLQQSSHVIP